VKLLLEANPKLASRNAGRISVGEELVIPDATTAERVLAGQDVKIAAAPADRGPGTSREQWYTIQRSDTLASIAKRFLNDGRRWPEIAAINRSLNPNKIFPGMRIKLPALIRMAQR
jgi:nucleoid-associated protein YgaU